jgi:hypothetical protein
MFQFYNNFTRKIAKIILSYLVNSEWSAKVCIVLGKDCRRADPHLQDELDFPHAF